MKPIFTLRIDVFRKPTIFRAPLNDILRSG
jgi:hypothetical protein